ncbi:purine transporter, putative [Ricinus communis]|uniref:Probable purine permease n=1 Tax=Ricinus communis TaxID=3988 RepID=B9RJN5_RICCO|nr:purine transporter, putative [Ricinus communis]|eukprot:XP_002513954.1 purine permease 1 isoform X1 [Ricinus communis]
MEAEQGSNSRPKQQENSKHIKILLVVLNCLLMSIGQVGGPLLIRLYYLHGGKRKWLTSWLLTAGFPILILPISSSYMIARARSRAPTSRLLLTRWLFAASAFIGLLLGLDGYLYSFGLSYLPVSVSSLLGSTQLAFTAIFAYIVVKHRFTHYSINAVVLMTFGSIILGFHMNGDVPNGESNGKYVLGFFMAVGAAALHGFIMPAVEYTHMNAGMPITFDLVMQVQFLISMFATLFCTIPMIINKDFQAIPKEAEKFGLGQAKYYTILVVAAVIMQLLIIGSLGVIFASTSLLGGLVSSLLVPVQQVFAVIFLHEVFNAEKGMALAMCLWGFASHLYGAYVESSKKQAKKKEESNCEVI